MSDLRYPLGRFTPPAEFTPTHRETFIRQLEEAPAALRAAVKGLTRVQLLTPYREGGWTVAQVVHHLADSHLHSYVRVKFALTEDNPTIKPYDEVSWATFPDAADPGTLELSLGLLDGLHARFVQTWRALDEVAWARPYVHPERGPLSLDRTLALYAWHGLHHTAHITSLRARMGW